LRRDALDLGLDVMRERDGRIDHALVHHCRNLVA
jgi:hypothetical protein